jgi:tetratricopeptide (TPR) repeat protein
MGRHLKSRKQGHIRAMVTSMATFMGKAGPRCILSALAFSAWFGPTAVAQERFKPQPNAVVLKSSIPAQKLGNSDFNTLSAAWRAQPHHLQTATDYARAVFILGLNEGDLRWYGSAKAALLPWWQDTQLPADTLFMRGLVRQGFHEFSAGLHDIDLAIAQNPHKTEYWSWRFVLNLLQSNMAAAEKDCQNIETYAGKLEAQQHRAVLYYRTGRAKLALQIFKDLQQGPDFPKINSEWFQFHWGEAYRVAGQPTQALSVWRQQLHATPASHLIRLSLAELLNQQALFAEAYQITAVDNPTDALLVQQLLASKGLQSKRTPQLAKLMATRLATQALRNESLIERPKMAYLIDYGADPQAGLQLAVENWKTQQEPRDAVLLVKAALLTKQTQAAAPVLAWAQQTQYTDPELSALLATLNPQISPAGGVK